MALRGLDLYLCAGVSLSETQAPFMWTSFYACVITITNNALVFFRSYSGSVLSWSYIRYSLRGRVVMEDSYGMQAKEPIRKVGRKHGLKQDKLKFFSMEKDGMSEAQKTQVL